VVFIGKTNSFQLAAFSWPIANDKQCCDFHKFLAFKPHSVPVFKLLVIIQMQKLL